MGNGPGRSRGGGALPVPIHSGSEDPLGAQHRGLGHPNAHGARNDGLLAILRTPAEHADALCGTSACTRDRCSGAMDIIRGESTHLLSQLGTSPVVRKTHFCCLRDAIADRLPHLSPGLNIRPPKCLVLHLPQVHR